MKLWWIRTFKVISNQEAKKLGLKFQRNIFGDEINILNCRSIWIDSEIRKYRVQNLELQISSNPIVATIDNTDYGFIFNTNVQGYVEHFMLRIHIGSNDYTLWFQNEAPKSIIYTYIQVIPIFDANGTLNNIEYIIN